VRKREKVVRGRNSREKKEKKTERGRQESRRE